MNQLTRMILAACAVGLIMLAGAPQGLAQVAPALAQEVTQPDERRCS
jgi:outer membrane murein-binding lipoprotein Lpp